MEKLTVIIPFLNEGHEIENTLISIRETAGNEVDILLIDDASASYDYYKYGDVANKYSARYIRNETRMGVARSRDIGVELIDTSYFLIVDGHMRFYNNDWWKVILEKLEENERAIYCCKCKPLDLNVKEIPDKPSYGAYIELIGERDQALSAQWIRKDMFSNKNLVSIPCILGACYAASKSYWFRLKGLSGLQMYGSDEVYISIKAWLEGGACILIKDIEIGHIFRNRPPYYINHAVLIFNKLLIAETLLPPPYKSKVCDLLLKEGEMYKQEILDMLKNHENEIKLLQQYYEKISIHTFDSFIQFNEAIKKEKPVLGMNFDSDILKYN